MTLFAQMPQGSLNGWLDWCAAHDWCADQPAWFDEMTGELVTYTLSSDGFNTHVEEARHKTPRELKAWAGY